MSHVKTVTLRALRQHSRYQRMAHDGRAILVTHRGRPYFRALPPEKTRLISRCCARRKTLAAKVLESVLAERERFTATRRIASSPARPSRMN
jgi:antitoxin (DNA-binding transcriptional repressor) of toxin-antitoxin stability system